MTAQQQKTHWWRGQRGEWYVVMQLLLFALIAFGPEVVPGLPRWGDSARTLLRPLGWLLTVTGVLIAGAGVFNLGPNLTPYPYPKADSTLVTTGVYGLVRHPIYSGILLAALGWALVKSSPLMIIYALLLFLLFDIKSRREEAWLAEKFPNYAAYQQRVRKLIPFIY